MKPDPASFRDPGGQVIIENDRVFRIVRKSALADFAATQDNETMQRLIAAGDIVASHSASPPSAEWSVGDDSRLVEHERIPFISYPYEWSFSLLKAAAVHHLDLQIALLANGVSLSDATAYNLQFIGVRPIFIDALSFKPYRDGDYWTAHRQFCEQFLNPLLLRSILGVRHNEWYRGAQEGVSTAALARLVPLHRRASLRLQTHVLMPAHLEARSRDRDISEVRDSLRKPLPRNAYLGMLHQLRAWISGMRPKGGKRTVWSDYEDTNSYDMAETEAKKRVIAEFMASCKPSLSLDLGCNTGLYAETALEHGAGRVIGFDYDDGALEGAYSRAFEKKLEFLPLYQDAANPSPGQGWNGEERAGLAARSETAQAVTALAFTHHLAIGRNIPLGQLAQWICRLAPTGVVEFTPKEDAMVRRLLALREDVFPDYDYDAFKSAFSRHARIVREEKITSSGRVLMIFDRT